MLHKKSMICLLATVILVVGVWTAAAGSLIDQRSVLSGEVTNTVAVGAEVGEGSELVRVMTIAGSATAARANAAGIVREVLVQPGSKINSGDVVVRLQAK